MLPLPLYQIALICIGLFLAIYLFGKLLVRVTKVPDSQESIDPSQLEDPDLPVTIATYQDQMRAEMARILLEREGILVYIFGDKVRRMVYWGGQINLELKVRARDAQRAIDILKRAANQEKSH